MSQFRVSLSYQEYTTIKDLPFPETKTEKQKKKNAKTKVAKRPKHVQELVIRVSLAQQDTCVNCLILQRNLPAIVSCCCCMTDDNNNGTDAFINLNAQNTFIHGDTN